MERNIQLLVRTHGVDGGPTANAREALAKLLEDADRWVEARVLREEVLSARRRNLGDDEEFTYLAEVLLAINLCHVGLIEEALPLAVHSRDGYRRLGDSGQAQRAGGWVSFIESGGAIGAN